MANKRNSEDAKGQKQVERGFARTLRRNSVSISQQRITKKHIESALSYIDSHGIPKRYEKCAVSLVKKETGKLYPPRYVFAVARKLAGITKSISVKGISAAEAKDVLTKMHFKLQEESVLVNIMYSGDYVNEKRSSSENVGHEWINLHADDKGKHYIYVTKGGTVDTVHKIGTMLMVRAVSKVAKPGNVAGEKCFDNSVEVIAKAEGCRPVSGKDGDPIGGNQLSWARNARITYDNARVEEIFSKNEEGRRKGLNVIWATFEAEKVFKVKKGVKIVLRRFTEEKITQEETEGKKSAEVKGVSESRRKKTVIVTLSKCPNNQSLRLFVVPDERLQGILDDPKWWEDKPVGKFRTRETDGNDFISSCFLTTIGKLNDELSYSNMIAHFLRADDAVCAKFIRMLLGKIQRDAGKDERKESFVSSKATTFSIDREEDHIDLLIRDKNATDGKGRYLIVIENKIDSGINGKKERGGQLTDYAGKAYAKCESELIPPKKAETQDSNAQTNGRKTEPKTNPDKGRFPLFFLLSPDYSRISEEERKTEEIRYRIKNQDKQIEAKSRDAVEYIPIFYSDLVTFFKNHRPKTFDHIEQQHFEEFLTALGAHSQEINNINELIMDDRAVKAIRRAKQRQKERRKQKR